jgi:iron complex outermembrane receptor protein
MVTMNDLYWYPGGNPELENEYAYQFETGADLKFNFEAPVELEFDLTLFMNRIHDMIQWLPGQYSYWQPVNVKNVIANGLETSANLSYKSEKTSMLLKAIYSFTSSEEVTSEGRSGYQLIYTPENQACLSFTVISGGLSASWSNKFTGIRYTSSDNSKYLPFYITGNITGGYSAKIMKVLLTLNIGIDNIYNTAYQSVAFYPMPGRSYNLSLMILI